MYGVTPSRAKKKAGLNQTLSYQTPFSFPCTAHYQAVFIMSSLQCLGSLGVSQCVQIDRPGSSFYVEVGASLSMIKSLGGVEAGLFMLVILEL